MLPTARVATQRAAFTLSWVWSSSGSLCWCKQRPRICQEVDGHQFPGPWDPQEPTVWWKRPRTGPPDSA